MLKFTITLRCKIDPDVLRTWAVENGYEGMPEDSLGEIYARQEVYWASESFEDFSIVRVESLESID